MKIIRSKRASRKPAKVNKPQDFRDNLHDRLEPNVRATFAKVIKNIGERHDRATIDKLVFEHIEEKIVAGMKLNMAGLVSLLDDEQEEEFLDLMVAAIQRMRHKAKIK